uniref:Uncharacterized protein n=2 Tax=Cacopsylla melanoneura TaxID=428564 RepID=A0A8D8VYC6_9HEMI
MKNIMTRGHLASSCKMIINDDNLTSEDIDLYVKLEQELKFLDQQIRHHDGFNSVIFKNLIIKIFESIRGKNCQILKLNDEISSHKTNLKEMYEQNTYLTQKMADQAKHITSLIEENDGINTSYEESIKDKNKEVQKLKGVIDTMNQTIVNLSQSNDNLESSTSQDFFLTPMKQTPSKNKKSKISLDFMKSRKQKSPDKFASPNVSLESTSIEPDHNLEQKLSNIDKNVEEILSKIRVMETKAQPVTVKTTAIDKPMPQQEQQDNSRIKVDQPSTSASQLILIMGDHHAKPLRASLSKHLPKQWKIEENILEDGDFPRLGSIKQQTKCSHLILMAGTLDIQKTPMFEIKEGIDRIIKKHKNSK